VYPDIKDTIEEFRTQNQTLWFTGHSLGGALAMLAGAKMYFEAPRLLADGIYTFGQPRTCDRLLAGAHNKAFTSRTYRFVNNNDIVAQVPPEPVYHHVDALRYIDAAGKVHNTMPFVNNLRDRGKGLTADLFAPASDASGAGPSPLPGLPLCPQAPDGLGLSGRAGTVSFRLLGEDRQPQQTKRNAPRAPPLRGVCTCGEGGTSCMPYCTRCPSPGP
jgi:hypothetical protein